MNLLHFSPSGGISDNQAFRLEADIKQAIDSGREFGTRAPQIRSVGATLRGDLKKLQAAITLLNESLTNLGIVETEQCLLLNQFVNSTSKLVDMAENYAAI